MTKATSKNNISIRLTNERWQHITIGHPEMADYYYEILEAIETPEVVYQGNNGAQIAIKKLQERNDKFVVVVYKEFTTTDGFVITAYFSKTQQRFQNEKILWKQPN